MESQYYISEGEGRKYFSQIPNLYDDAKLSVWEFRLLIHYVRRGNTYESLKTTAETCKMSRPQVVKARNELEKKGFISTVKKKRETVKIAVVDKWAENMSKYATSKPQEQGVPTVSQGVPVVYTKNTPLRRTYKNKANYVTENQPPNPNERRIAIVPGFET